MSILIKGGRIITAADDYVADVFIANGTISTIGQSLDVSAERTIDATGKIVMPGAIDPHTHLEMFFGGTTTCDDFTSGTTAAAFGGTTTLIDFCVQTPGDTFAEALAKYHEKIERCKPVIDVGFHIAVTDLHTGGTLEDLAKLPDEGITSYKLFMAYKGAVMVDDATLFKVMQVAHETGALVMVHAENGDAIDIIVKETVAAGNTDPVWHARSRPMETEAEATNRAIQLARVADAPLYVVHVSCQPSVEPIALAREKGWRVWGESCTQYFFIDDSMMEAPNWEGAKYIYTPPPRPKDQQEHLWKAIRSDVLSAVSTDHCPFNWPEQKGINGREFQVVPNGGPGIENRLHMLWTFGVGTGRITPNRFVELVSTNVAKLFGLYPRKGTIAPGSDADIVIWDPNKKLTISAATHHTNVNYNLFEGTEVTGAPEVVLVRGQVIVENDELVAKPGAGQFVKRARFGEDLLAAPSAVV
ncbi:MAG: dihydropyrimidinase [Thermoleophilia bacterium]|nr:dihydropyrimidinase [Thermoleophilia bacterium]